MSGGSFWTLMCADLFYPGKFPISNMKNPRNSCSPPTGGGGVLICLAEMPRSSTNVAWINVSRKENFSLPLHFASG